MATTQTFPAQLHANNVTAAADLVNQALSQGYTTAALANLSEKGLHDSLLANLIQAGTLTEYTVSFNPASVNAATTAEQAVTVTGVLTTDLILSVTPASALTAGTFISGFRISAADTVQLAFGNVTAGALDPAAAINFVFVVLRP